MDVLSGIKARFRTLRDVLDDRSRRMLLAAESQSMVEAIFRRSRMQPERRDGSSVGVFRNWSSPPCSRRAGFDGPVAEGRRQPYWILR